VVTITTSALVPGFSNEAGGHRIQRIPPTERKGRVHSSTVTVSVLERAQSSDLHAMRRKEDFSYRWFGATGAGGQHANKHHNSLELTHLPTGLSVKAQGRSRAANERQAMDALLAKLDAESHTAGYREQNAIRSGQIGSGMRGDKRRTYRFRDDQVEDHQTGKRTSARKFMRGDLELLWSHQSATRMG
jgi:peptide chain release factor 1